MPLFCVVILLFWSMLTLYKNCAHTRTHTRSRSLSQTNTHTHICMVTHTHSHTIRHTHTYTNKHNCAAASSHLQMSVMAEREGRTSDGGIAISLNCFGYCFVKLFVYIVFIQLVCILSYLFWSLLFSFLLCSYSSPSGDCLEEVGKRKLVDNAMTHSG